MNDDRSGSGTAQADLAAAIPDAWVPGLTKLCRPDRPHEHQKEACTTLGKRPVLKGFTAEAVRRYRDIEQGRAGARELAQWRQEAVEWLEAGYNVGLVPPPGVVVLDCDTEATVTWVADQIAPLVGEGKHVAIQSRTEAKAHFWLRFDDMELPLRATQLRFTLEGSTEPLALDLRVGGRSQAVVWPSRHPSGVPYEWIQPLPPEIADLAVLPGSLARALEVLLHLQAPDPAAAPAASQAPGARSMGVLAAGADGEPLFLPGRGRAQGSAETTAGHDRLRGYINRMCRYSSGDNPEAAKADIRARAERFARDLYGSRPERLAGVVAPGGELDKLLESGWVRFGGRAPLLEDKTDQGYLDTLTATWGDRWRWLVERAQWREYRPETGVWEETHEEMLARAVGGLHAILFEDALRELDLDRRDRLLAMAKQMRNSGKVRAVVARAKAAWSVSEALFDADPWLLAFPGGVVGGEYRPPVVLDLAADDVRASARAPELSDYLTRTMGAPWVDGGRWRSEEWERFLASTVPDPELRAFLARGAGVTACGVTLAHVFFFLFGPGGTGKSTMLGALSEAFGSYAVRCDFRTFAEDARRSSSGASPDVARLRGGRIAVCSEIPDRTYLGARMKDLTGGDRIVGRHLYGKEVEFLPSHTVWVAGNCEPAAEFLDTGVWRRMQQLPFEVAHARMDAALPLRLGSPEALAAIGAWIVSGWIDYRAAGGLGECPAVREATEAFRERLDPLAEWFEECCELEAGARVPSADAWVHYQAHCDARGRAGARISQTKFAALLRSRGVETAKGAKGARMLVGMRIPVMDITKNTPKMGLGGGLGWRVEKANLG